VRAWLAPLAGVALVLAGLAAVLTPMAPAAATAPAPAQGWTTLEAPLPSDSGNGTTNPDVYTASTACPIANGCITVGWYKDDGTPQKVWGLIETQNGTTWTDTEAPQPGNAGSGSEQGLWIGSQQCGIYVPCHAISCPSPSSCVAVGNYLDTSGFSLPLVETMSGGNWSATGAPLPSDTGTDGGAVHPDAFLFSVDCASPTSCVAVGSYRNTSSQYFPFIDTLSGTTWSTLTSPLPSNAAPGSISFESTLSGISCPTPTSCTASGVYQDTSSGNPANALLVTLANGAWTAQRAPEPSDAGNDGDGSQVAFLVQVSCPTPSACTAVGVYFDNTHVEQGLIDTFNGSAWVPTRAPLPSDAGPGFTQLSSVSCPTPAFCTAVGLYSDTSHKDWGVIDTLSGGTWSTLKAPQPSNAADETNQNAVLYDVSCPTPSFCIAPGSYEVTYPGPVNASTGYIETMSGGRWHTMEAPVPSNAAVSGSQYSTARTVGCYSPVACAVGGYYEDPGNSQGFLDTYTGVQGYWLDASDGGIFTYPNALFYGSAGSLVLNKPVVGMAATPDGGGYWLDASDGGIFTYGDAGFHGSAGSLVLNQPVVGMAATPDGGGYWLVASDGGIFNYGDAGFFGSRGGQPLNKPIVGMAATPTGLGYWLVASDGGIFSYGDALFYGSTGSLVLNKPIVGMTSSPTGLGYWLVASDGGIFNYGDALFYGSTGSIVLNKPVVGMAASPSGLGYWLVATDGGIFNYGDAPFYGSTGSLVLNKPVVGMAGG
jgi:hypothetical protein